MCWFTQRSWKSLHVPIDLKPTGQPPWVPAAAFSQVCVSARQNCEAPHCEWCVQPDLQRWLAESQ